MRVFVTGATGWIGSAAVGELLSAGHEVAGLTRSDGGAAALSARGAVPVRGDVDDLDSLLAGAAAADAVVHLANKHDWTTAPHSGRRCTAPTPPTSSDWGWNRHRRAPGCMPCRGHPHRRLLPIQIVGSQINWAATLHTRRNP